MQTEKFNEIIPEKSAVDYISLEFLERFLFTKSLEIIYRPVCKVGGKTTTRS